MIIIIAHYILGSVVYLNNFENIVGSLYANCIQINNVDHQYDYRMLRDTNNQEERPKMMTQYVNGKGHTVPQALCACVNDLSRSATQLLSTVIYQIRKKKIHPKSCQRI